MAYANPVLPGTHPDPTVCRAGEDYYLAVSSFEYFPGVPLFHSRDLVSWKRIGHCLTRDEQVDLRGRAAADGIYAPTLRYHDGTFYLVTTDVGGDGHLVVTTEDARGAWSDPTYVDAGGIDPDLFFANDGTVYFQWTDGPTLPEFRIRQAEIDLATGELGEHRLLWQGIEGGFAEAPHLYERDGTYYLLAAEGGTHTGHMVTVGRSDDPTGPFELCPDNPIVSHRGHPTHPIGAVGHADLVQTRAGEWWLVCLGIRQRGGHPGWHHLGRETFLAPVAWVEGWPVVNGGDPIEGEMDATGLPGAAPYGPADPASPFETTFDGDLEDGWVFRRNPAPETYSLSGEGLTLQGGAGSLTDRDATVLLRPQAHFDCRITADLTVEPAADAAAGLLAITDERHHYAVGVTRDDGRRVVRVRRRVGDLADVAAERSVDGPTHRLSIEATSDSYRFQYGEETDLATAATRYLATEVAGGFTGVYVGPYVLGSGASARFDRFRYAPGEASD